METPSFIENSLVTTPADDLVKPNPGWIVYEEVGIAVVSDYTVSKIEATQPFKFKWLHVDTPELPKYWPTPIGETGRMFDME